MHCSQREQGPKAKADSLLTIREHQLSALGRAPDPPERDADQ